MSDLKYPERLYAFDPSSRDYRDYAFSPPLQQLGTVSDDSFRPPQDQHDVHSPPTTNSPPNDDFLSEVAESDLSLDTPSSSHTLSLLSLTRDDTEQQTREQRKVISIHAPNPSHLFWVPAAQHPEIAPAEFEKFLQADAIAKRERASLKRRSSILSVSFTASDAAKQSIGEMDEATRQQQWKQWALEINNTSTGQSIGGQGLLDVESEAQRKTRLRRSISLDMAKAAEVQLHLPDLLVFDRNSSPLDQSRVLVPRVDRPSLLRRGARTKFQRNSVITPSSSERQVDRHHQAESIPPIRLDISDFEGITLSDTVPPSPRSSFPPSPALSTSTVTATTPTSSITPGLSGRPSSLSSPRPELQRRASAEGLSRQHQHGNLHSHAAGAEMASLPASASASVPAPASAPALTSSGTVPIIVKTISEGSQLEPVERVERKSSSWSWSFRKSKSEHLRQQETSSPPNATPGAPGAPAPVPAPIMSGRKSPEPRPSVSTESGGGKRFGLSSLFSRKGASGKVQPNPFSASSTTVPKDFQLNRINQNRLPIHIERAIYRLSHTKLSNSRRPLHEQVLISNFMFWYLSTVNSSQATGNDPADSGRRFVHAGKKGKRRPPSQAQQQQQQQQRVAKGAPPQQHQQNAALHQYMSSNASTGFVIPENYLKPHNGPKHRKPSLSDSDDDDGDDQSSDSSSGSDDEPSNATMPMAARKTKDGRQKPTRVKKPPSSSPKHTHPASKVKDGGDDDIPLAMYKKNKA